MKRKILAFFSTAVFLLSLTAFTQETQPTASNSHIKRLTHSGNNAVLYPCLSDNGNKILYVLEIIEDEAVTKTVRILDVETGEDKELYRSGTRPSPAPFEGANLLVGSKPPQLSGNGNLAVFSLSVGEPEFIPDHYLAAVHTDGSGFQILPFPIHALEGKDLKSLDIEVSEWERVSNYQVDTEGKRIACLVKGHMGPRRMGNPSGIYVFDMDTALAQTLLAPDLVDGNWIWTSTPQNPLTGGGWGFGLSGNGSTIFFGAQSSDEKSDYDLYSMDWQGGHITKITNIKDRWFSQLDVSQDGGMAVFYYTGQKEKGVGTYLLNRNGGQTVFLQSPAGSHIEFFDMSASGRYIVYKKVYTGMMYDVTSGTETIIFDENTSGYVKGPVPMDFPRIPAFWCPKILSSDGDRILLIGSPPGQVTPELYMLFLK